MRGGARTREERCKDKTGRKRKAKLQSVEKGEDEGCLRRIQRGSKERN